MHDDDRAANSSAIHPDLNHLFGTATPAPAATGRKVMITEQANPAAMAVVKRIGAIRENHDAAVEALKQEFQQRAKDLETDSASQHEAAWGELETILGLDPNQNHALCDEHLEDFGVAFIMPAEEFVSAPDGLKGKLGALLAKALGGRLVSDDGQTGIVEIDPRSL